MADSWSDVLKMGASTGTYPQIQSSAVVPYLSKSVSEYSLLTRNFGFQLKKLGHPAGRICYEIYAGNYKTEPLRPPPALQVLPSHSHPPTKVS